MDEGAIEVELLLQGGHRKRIVLAPDAPELALFLQVLGARAAGQDATAEQFFQLPLAGGTESFSFSSTELVGLTTHPPVLAQFDQQAPAPAGFSEYLHRPAHMVIDNFLGPYEHADMLAHALQQEQAFDNGTVATGELSARENLAILEFGTHAHSTLIINRLLTWLPQILKTLEMDPFPVHQVESQLTASNDGHYYRAHVDADEASNIERALTCVYYFSRQPLQFAGGGLRLYDSLFTGGERLQAGSYQQFEPLNNRLLVFPSDSFHELLPTRVPSRRFADSRFAITNWVWRAREADEQATHGWGHMQCGRLPANVTESPS